MTVAKVQETRSTRMSGSFRRAPSARQRIGPAPAATGAVSVSLERGVPPTSAPGAHQIPLAHEGPHTVSSDTASPDHHVERSAPFTLPGTVFSSASGDARTAAENPPAYPAAAQGEDGGPASTGSAKEARSTSNSGVLRGVVVLGEGGQPVLVDEGGGGPDAAAGAAVLVGENGSRSARGARHSTVEMMELEVVKSVNGDAAALFRAVTPAETARRAAEGRKQPAGGGWWEDDEGGRAADLGDAEHGDAAA